MIRRLRQVLREARESLRYDGAMILAWRALTKVLSPIVHLDVQVLFEIDLTKPIEARTPRIDCVIEQATEADLDRILDSRFTPLARVDESRLSDEEEYEHLRRERDIVRLRASVREEMRHALRAGELCFVARVGEEIAHSNWIQFHWCGRVAGRPIRLLPGEVYSTEAYTDTRWRGKALHEAVLSRMLRHAQSLGGQHAYTIADLTNVRSRKGVERVGWMRRGHHLFVKLRKVDRTWIIQLGGDVEPILRGLREQGVV